jgi:TolB protein
LTQITERPAFTPTWSPNGAKIAFTSFVDGQSDLYVMDADGSNHVQVTRDPAIDFDPQWR